MGESLFCRWQLQGVFSKERLVSVAFGHRKVALSGRGPHAEPLSGAVESRGRMTGDGLAVCTGSALPYRTLMSGSPNGCVQAYLVSSKKLKG